MKKIKMECSGDAHSILSIKIDSKRGDGFFIENIIEFKINSLFCILVSLLVFKEAKIWGIFHGPSLTSEYYDEKKFLKRKEKI